MKITNKEIILQLLKYIIFILLYFNCLIFAKQEQLELAKNNISQTIKIKQALYKAKADSLQKQAFMQDLLKILQDKSKTLDAKITKFQKTKKDHKDLKATIAKSKIAYQNSVKLLASKISILENKLKEIAQKLPLPIQDELARKFKQLNEKRPLKAINKSLQIALSFLAELDFYSNHINAFEEVQDIEGKQLNINSFYIGLTYGYFFNKAQQKVGYIYYKDLAWHYKLFNYDKDITYQVIQNMRSVLEIKDAKKMASLVKLPFIKVSAK